jgi:hypothetical protein
VIAVSGLNAVAPLLASAQALLLHEPGHAVAPVTSSGFAQLHDDARAAVSLATACMDGLDLLLQSLVLEDSRARATAPGLPVIVTTGRNLQLLAEPQDGMLVFHRVDPFIPFEDGSERMPNVFLK